MTLSILHCKYSTKRMLLMKKKLRLSFPVFSGPYPLMPPVEGTFFPRRKVIWNTGVAHTLPNVIETWGIPIIISFLRFRENGKVDNKHSIYSFVGDAGTSTVPNTQARNAPKNTLKNCRVEISLILGLSVTRWCMLLAVIYKSDTVCKVNLKVVFFLPRL